MRLNRKTILEWGAFILIFAVLYGTDIGKEITGKIQQFILSSEIIQPTIDHKNEASVPASYNVELTSENGAVISMDSLRGKVIFMNFWATWCAPCIAEMPSIDDLYQDIDHDKVAFLMIAKDQEFQKAIKFKQRKGLSFPIYKLRKPLPEEYKRSSIPTTFIISPSGNIVAEHTGMAYYNSNKFKEKLLTLK